MSHKPFRATFGALLLAAMSVLAACSSSKTTDAPLSSSGGSSHPEWSQYTFTIGDDPPITGAAKQFGFKIVAVQRGTDQNKAAENIIVPKGSPIQTPADLRGKKLAIPQGSSAHGLAL